MLFTSTLPAVQLKHAAPSAVHVAQLVNLLAHVGHDKESAAKYYPALHVRQFAEAGSQVRQFGIDEHGLHSCEEANKLPVKH
jgi:hypothetical protein